MLINDEYKKRTKDIGVFYEILVFIDGIETYRGKAICDTNTGHEFFLDREMQQCLRAEAIIVLYNAIESTISNCVQLLYDAIHDSELKYSDLSHSLRKIWLEFQLPSNMDIKKIRETSYEIVERLSISKVSFSQLPSRMSGNLDMRQIIAICKSLGISLEHIPDFKRTAEIFLSIKNKRNDLAHGNKSFSAVGTLLTINELIEYKDKTLNLLDYVVRKFQKYVDNREYCQQFCKTNI